MGDSINVNSAAASSDASQISNAAGYFTGQSLAVQDNISTITANDNCKQSFQRSQGVAVSLGKALDADAANIRNLGLAFEEFDQMMGSLNGQRK